MAKELITNKFSENAIEFMRKEIYESNDNEVYFGVNLNNHNMLDYIEVISRGNENSAPAIMNTSLEYDAVVHNHPSGNLTPSRNDIGIASELGNDAGVGFLIVNNNVTEYYEVIKPIRAEKIEPLDAGDVLYTYAEDGELSEIIEGYEYRHEQAVLAEAIIEAFNNNTSLMAEAGTGIGKSFAYLIPALFWLKQNKTRIVVSTNTINLQQQIIEKDLPLIAPHLAENIVYTLVKGRGNYICINKVKEAIKEDDESLSFGDVSDEREQFLSNIDLWLETTKDGSVTDLGFKPRNDLWEIVRSDNDTCLGRKCKYADKCFFYKMKKRLNASQLLIVNHHILCADIALHAQTGGTFSFLPKYSKVIIDEAHNFEDCASSYFGQDGSKTSIMKALFYIHNSKKNSKAKGISERIRSVFRDYVDDIKPEDFEKAMGLADAIASDAINIRAIVDESSKAFYAYCVENIDLREGSSFKFRITQSLHESSKWQKKALPHIRSMASSVLSIVNNMNSLYKLFIDTSVENSIDYEDIAKLAQAYTERMKANLTSLNAAFNYKEDEYIRWVESKITKNGILIFSWHLTPVNVSKYLNDYLYKRFETSVLVSATLTVNKKFDFFADRLGFSLINKNKRDNLYLESPFNYQDNARLYVPTDCPDVTSFEFTKFISKFILRSMDITGGRAFALFTSFSTLMKVYEDIELPLKNININTLTQASGIHRNALLDLFKSSENNILLGVDSFWEGVDVVGKNLELVIIPKLPFAVPTDPISEGRYEYIQNSGGNAFIDYAMPFAIIKFKQGFGRLIRSKTDRGAVVVLDKRIITKKYGESFIRSLPNAKFITTTVDNIIEDMSDFF